LADATHPRSPQQPFRITTPERFCSHPVLSGTIKKRESFVPETIKNDLKAIRAGQTWSGVEKKCHQYDS